MEAKEFAPDAAQMRKVGIKMNLLMGFWMSLVLSYIGTRLGGHPSLKAHLVSFGISFLISLIIGFSVPVKRLGDSACNLLKVNPFSFRGNLVTSFVSNLIYTPAITIIMVGIMITAARKAMLAAGITQGLPDMRSAIIHSLGICLIVGYVTICIFQPFLLNLVMPKKDK